MTVDVEERTVGGSRRRELPPVLIAIVGALVAVVGIVVIAVTGLPGGGGGGSGTDDGGQSVAALDRLDVQSEPFHERWNAAMAEQDGDHRLPDPSWEPDEPIGMEGAAHSVGDWALIELYRDADDWMTAVVITAQPRTAAHEATFEAAATATIAAILELDVPAAADVLRDDLGAGATGAGAIDERYEQAGVAVSLQREGSTWRLRVTVADA